jgi:hypothetical protein
MITKVFTTAKQLYDASPVLRGMIEQWVTDCRCPIQMVDYLMEHDLYSQAEAARWAATEPDRPSIRSPRGSCGPYPEFWASLGWCWTVEALDKLKYHHRLPTHLVNPFDDQKDPRPLANESVIWLLDNFIPQVQQGDSHESQEA